jgi:shikimate kinase/3-dehydroquinate synthase
MICLVGFMGAGKSSALSVLAESGLETLDVDARIEERAGCPIPTLFERDGEASFRELELEVTLEALADDRLEAVALGGGSIGSAPIREALKSPRHRVIWIGIEPEEAWRRVEGSARPLARDRDGFDRLFIEREPLYREVADVHLPADGRRNITDALPSIRFMENLPAGSLLIWATGESGSYPVIVGRGIAGPSLAVDAPPWSLPASSCVLVTDDAVGGIYGSSLPPTIGTVSIHPGESSKSLTVAEEVLSEMARLGTSRSDGVIALGGGVVGDLAGFCAATYQRGIPVLQVPTTLVAQVDSAIGGKTGVDLPEGKNYVGAFHSPSAVIADVDMLGTLPPEELAAGMAEVIKTGLLAGGTLWEQIRSLDRGEILDRPDIIAGCAGLKCDVVAADERESSVRAQLNLGHTVGHAIETATGYGLYRHGEAVALGLLAALRLSEADALRQEVERLNVLHGLPVELSPEVGVDAVVEAIAFDKKKTSEGVGFVTLETPGNPRTGVILPDGKVREAVEELVR